MQESRFRIASYNVLAKCYAKTRHFTRCKPEYLRWDVRRKALMEVVRELDADILCLQEVDNYSHFWVKELQHLGYTGCYKQRNADSKNDGCATFFRTEKFEKVSHDSIEFDRVPDEGGKRPDFATHNVALLTLLRPTSVSDGSCICVANAHLFWDPMYEDVKLAQARALVKAAEDMVHESGVQAPATPIILAGDFNSMPGSDVYNFLTRDAAFSSSYVACGKTGDEAVDIQRQWVDRGGEGLHAFGENGRRGDLRAGLRTTAPTFVAGGVRSRAPTRPPPSCRRT